MLKHITALDPSQYDDNDADSSQPQSPIDHNTKFDTYQSGSHNSSNISGPSSSSGHTQHRSNNHNTLHLDQTSVFRDSTDMIGQLSSSFGNSQDNNNCNKIKYPRNGLPNNKSVGNYRAGTNTLPSSSSIYRDGVSLDYYDDEDSEYLYWVWESRRGLEPHGRSTIPVNFYDAVRQPPKCLSGDRYS